MKDYTQSPLEIQLRTALKLPSLAEPLSAQHWESALQTALDTDNERKEDGAALLPEAVLKPDTDKAKSLFLAAITGDINSLALSTTKNLTHQEVMAWRKAAFTPSLKDSSHQIISTTPISMAAARGNFDALVRIKEKCMYSEGEWKVVMRTSVDENANPPSPPPVVLLKTTLLLQQNPVQKKPSEVRDLSTADLKAARSYLKISGAILDIEGPLTSTASTEEQRQRAMILYKRAQQLFNISKLEEAKEEIAEAKTLIKAAASKNRKSSDIKIAERIIQQRQNKINEGISEYKRLAALPYQMSEYDDRDSKNDIIQIINAAIFRFNGELKTALDALDKIPAERRQRDFWVVFEQAKVLYATSNEKDRLAAIDLLLEFSERNIQEPQDALEACDIALKMLPNYGARINSYLEETSRYLAAQNKKSVLVGTPLQSLKEEAETALAGEGLLVDSQMVRDALLNEEANAPYISALQEAKDAFVRLERCANFLTNIGRAEKALSIYREIGGIYTRISYVHTKFSDHDPKRKGLFNDICVIYQRVQAHIPVEKIAMTPPHESEGPSLHQLQSPKSALTFAEVTTKGEQLQKILNEDELNTLWNEAEKSFDNAEWQLAFDSYRAWRKGWDDYKISTENQITQIGEEKKGEGETEKRAEKLGKAEQRLKISIQRHAICLFKMSTNALLAKNFPGSQKNPSQMFEAIAKDLLPRALASNHAVTYSDLDVQIPESSEHYNIYSQYIILLNLHLIFTKFSDFSDHDWETVLERHRNALKEMPNSTQAKVALAIALFTANKNSLQNEGLNQGIHRFFEGARKTYLIEAKKACNTALKNQKTSIEGAVIHVLLAVIQASLEDLPDYKPGFLEKKSTTLYSQALQELHLSINANKSSLSTEQRDAALFLVEHLREKLNLNQKGRENQQPLLEDPSSQYLYDSPLAFLCLVAAGFVHESKAPEIAIDHRKRVEILVVGGEENKFGAGATNTNNHERVIIIPANDSHPTNDESHLNEPGDLLTYSEPNTPQVTKTQTLPDEKSGDKDDEDEAITHQEALKTSQEERRSKLLAETKGETPEETPTGEADDNKTLKVPTKETGDILPSISPGDQAKGKAEKPNWFATLAETNRTKKKPEEQQTTGDNNDDGNSTLPKIENETPAPGQNKATPNKSSIADKIKFYNNKGQQQVPTARQKSSAS